MSNEISIIVILAVSVVILLWTCLKLIWAHSDREDELAQLTLERNFFKAECAQFAKRDVDRD